MWQKAWEWRRTKKLLDANAPPHFFPSVSLSPSKPIAQLTTYQLQPVTSAHFGHYYKVEIGRLKQKFSWLERRNVLAVGMGLEIEGRQRTEPKRRHVSGLHAARCVHPHSTTKIVKSAVQCTEHVRQRGELREGFFPTSQTCVTSDRFGSGDHKCWWPTT